MKLSNPTVAKYSAPEADVDTHQADVDIHQADVDTHQADVEIHQADVDTRQTDVSCLKGTDTSVTAERKGKSGNIPNGSSAVAVGCLGKKRKLPGWLSMGSVDGEREGSKEKKVKGNSVHWRPLYLEECTYHALVMQWLILLSGKTPAVASKPPAKRRARISSDEDVKKSAPTKVPSLAPAQLSA